MPTVVNDRERHGRENTCSIQARTGCRKLICRQHGRIPSLAQLLPLQVVPQNALRPDPSYRGAIADRGEFAFAGVKPSGVAHRVERGQHVDQARTRTMSDFVRELAREIDRSAPALETAVADIDASSQDRVFERRPRTLTD